MKAVNIKLSLTENVKTFVNIVSRYPYDVDLRAGRHVVDAKSILGIFSLDLSKPVTVEVYSDNCDDMMEEIKPFNIKAAGSARGHPAVRPQCGFHFARPDSRACINRSVCMATRPARAAAVRPPLIGLGRVFVIPA